MSERKVSSLQTFLPYDDFRKSAAVLDYRRLGKQRVECLQILNTLTGKSDGWKNHPAVRMWRGFECALAIYAKDVIDEWVRRGYRNTIDLSWTNELRSSLLPPWFGDKEFHASHRSNLLRKDAVHYGQFGWKESADLPYVWPVKGNVL